MKPLNLGNGSLNCLIELVRCFIFTFACLVCTLHARIVDVSEFGIVPGRDVTMQVNDLVQALKGEANVTLSFPKGQYDFYPENAVEVYRTVANHDNGLKRMAFPLFGHKNLTIEGNGSLFMFHGRLVPFTLDGTAQISLKNFEIDFIRPFHAELTVIERDEDTRTILVETDTEQSPYKFIGDAVYFDRLGQDDALVGSNIVFDPKTGAPIHNAHLYGMKRGTLKAEPAGKGRLKLINGFRKLPPVGSVLVVYGDHPTSRLCHAIQITNSKDILIKNVTVRSAGGMGLIVERTENVTLDGMKITSAENRLVATRADATHFIGCKGLIEVKNSTFEHMLDDGINVHGVYVPVVKQMQGRTFLCEISHFQQWGMTFAEPGDKVALLTRKTILPFFETTVAAVRKLNERRFLVTLEDLPSEMPDVPLSLENLTWNPDLVMRNNTIHKNRARSVLVTTKGSVLIEDNYFSSQMHGILIEGDNNFWYESGAVQDVIIRNNTFANIGFGHAEAYPLIASPKFTREQIVGEGRYHRNIRFSGNTIESFNGLFVHARSVENLIIEHNTLKFSKDYPKDIKPSSVSLEYCKQVELKHNTAIGFEQPLVVLADATSEAITMQNNRGFDGNDFEK